MLGIFLFLINSLVGFYLFILMSRVWMQKCRVNYWNVIVQFVIKSTDPLVKPARRLVPGYKEIDFSIVFVIYALQLVWLSVVSILYPEHVTLSWPQIFLLALLKVVVLSLDFTSYLILFSVVCSWLFQRNPGPFSLLVKELSQPALSVVKRFSPVVSGIDFSPLVLLLIVEVLRFVFAYVSHAIAVGLAWVA